MEVCQSVRIRRGKVPEILTDTRGRRRGSSQIANQNPTKRCEGEGFSCRGQRKNSEATLRLIQASRVVTPFSRSPPKHLVCVPGVQDILRECAGGYWLIVIDGKSFAKFVEHDGRGFCYEAP
jgi:hypothetical protein